MSPYANELATARLGALRTLIEALNQAETPDEKRRCAVAIFNAPDPCDLDDAIQPDNDENDVRNEDEDVKSDDASENSHDIEHDAAAVPEPIPQFAPPTVTAPGVGRFQSAAASPERPPAFVPEHAPRSAFNSVRRPSPLDLVRPSRAPALHLRSIAGTAHSRSQNDKSPATRPDP